jgi:hypothetical protein
MHPPQSEGVTPALDDIGISDNIVLIFSPYEKLVNSYTGKLLTVKRTSDNATQDFYPQASDNKLSQSAVESFVGASDGLVTSVGNQAKPTYPIYQNTDASCPKIVVSGSYQPDGLLFDGSDDFFKIDEYSEIEMTSRPIGVWANFKGSTVSGDIFAKNEWGAATTTYGLKINWGNGTIYSILGGNIRHTTPVIHSFTEVNKAALGWYSGGANDGIVSLRCNDSLGVGVTPFTSSFSDRPNVRIGCRVDQFGEASFIGTYMKSVLIANIELYSYYSQLAAKDI